mgnify:CR=1 FL=1
MAHLGRPKGEWNLEFSLEPAAKHLAKVLGEDVLFVKSPVGEGADKELEAEMDKAGLQFSSANSINIGRLCPQITYYFYSYMQLVKNNEIQLHDKVNFVVPTGNFGNILAAYYAKRMGLPIAKLICASNKNKVLTDFIATGTYDRNREFFTTISPSMDILISSNLERLLFDLCGNDAKKVNKWMNDLKEKLEENGVAIEFTEEFEDYMSTKGYEPAYGARPIKRLMQKELINILAKSILEGQVRKDSVILISMHDGQIAVSSKA